MIKSAVTSTSPLIVWSPSTRVVVLMIQVPETGGLFVFVYGMWGIEWGLNRDALEVMIRVMEMSGDRGDKKKSQG